MTYFSELNDYDLNQNERVHIFLKKVGKAFDFKISEMNKRGEDTLNIVCEQIKLRGGILGFNKRVSELVERLIVE